MDERKEKKEGGREGERKRKKWVGYNRLLGTSQAKAESHFQM